MNSIYFDHGSTTKVRSEVIEAMLPFFDKYYGNPSGLNSFSKLAKKALEQSRETIANIISAEPGEIIFTSGATESNNLAIKGFIRARDNKQDHIISSKIEHSSVLNPCHQLEREGWDYNTIETDKEGRVLLDDLALLINPKTILVSIMHANNEIGTIQPIKAVSEVLKSKGVVFHVDAAQTLGKIPFNVKDLGVDMASFSAHKLYGPKGIGALYLKHALKINPLLLGGGQESNLRSGTTNVPLIVGFAKALELAVADMESAKHKLHNLQRIIMEGISEINDVCLNGPANLEERIPGNLHYTCTFVESDALLLHLDLNNIIVSGGSACNSEKISPSHVLLAIGLKDTNRYGSIRITLGRENTPLECEYFVDSLKKILATLRNHSASGIL